MPKDSLKPLRNPYDEYDGFYCFGCSRKNPAGLQMSFSEEEDAVSCRWRPRPEHQGYHNVVHGGIQSTLMDEIASWAIFMKLDTAGVTSSMAVRFRHSVAIDQELLLRAKIREKRRQLVIVDVTLQNSEGTVCTEAEIVYYTYPKEKMDRLMFPGRDAFRPE